MFVYILLLTAIIIIALIVHPKRSENRRKLFMLLVFFILTGISGFRDFSVGVDTKSYINIFDNIELINFSSSRYETGFLYYVSAVHAVSHNPTFFLLVSSVLCIGPVCAFIYKHSDAPLLAVLLFITLKHYFFEMTGMRQAMATSFLLISFSALLKERTLKSYCVSYFFAILSVAIHSMSYVAFVPLILWQLPEEYFLKKIRPRSVVKWSITFSVCAFVFYSFLVFAVNNIFPRYSSYFEGIYSDSNFTACLFKMLIQVVFLFLGAYYVERKNHISDTDRLSLVMMMLSVVIATLAMRMECWGRLSGIFSIYTALVWAPSFTECPRNLVDKQILRFSVFAFSLAYMVVTFIYRPEWDGVVPYAFVHFMGQTF